MRLDYDGRLRLRRAFGVVVPLALVGLLVGVVEGSVGGPAQALAPESSASRAPAPPSTALASPTPPTTTSPDALSPQTPRTPAAPKTPDGPGVTLQLMPRADGSVEVFEQVLLDEPTITLGLTPPSVAAAGSPFTTARSVATSVQIVVDGQPLALPTTRIDGPLTVALPRPARELQLRYVLEGTVVRSIPSSSGRAVIAVGPLSRVAPGDARATIDVPADTVRNITCPLLSDSALVCARSTAEGSRLVATLTVADALAILQADLPRP